MDTNFAAQGFWKDAILRFFGKRSAVLEPDPTSRCHYAAGRFWPGMNNYTYSGQDLSQKNFAPVCRALSASASWTAEDEHHHRQQSVNAYHGKGQGRCLLLVRR